MNIKNEIRKKYERGQDLLLLSFNTAVKDFILLK